MMPVLWFGPDVSSDLVPLVSRPDEWMHARASCSTLQLYIQQILVDHEGEQGCGVNVYPNLVHVNFFRRVRDLGLELAVECGGIKEWSCDGENAAHALGAAIERVRAAGGELAAAVLDEPLRSKDRCHLDVAGCTAPVCRVIEAGRSRGLHQVGIVEAYPASPAADIVRFFENVQQAGSSPSFLHLDVDRIAFRDRKMKTDQIGRDLRWLRDQCRAWQIPFGIIVWGQRPTDPASYRASAWDWVQQIPQYLGGWPDRLIVQSWEEFNGAHAMPHNLPESDHVSHAALLRDVATKVHA